MTFDGDRFAAAWHRGIDAFAGPAFNAWGVPVTWLEIVAFGLSVAMVACNLRLDPRGWPLAIASSVLYAALFWRNRLYGDATLQGVFVAMAAWGWWCWKRPGTGRVSAVRALRLPGRAATVAAIALAWPATAWFLARYTDTDVPWWDAFPTAASEVGQWLLARKFVDNWTVWLVVNAVGTLLFVHKGLWLTALLYGLFAALSVAGWAAWKREMAA